jgi:hypothetical protein
MYPVFYSDSLKGRIEYLENHGVDGRIILHPALKKMREDINWVNVALEKPLVNILADIWVPQVENS